MKANGGKSKTGADLSIEWHEGNDRWPEVQEKLFYKNAVNLRGENLERIGVNLKEWM